MKAIYRSNVFLIKLIYVNVIVRKEIKIINKLVLEPVQFISLGAKIS